MHFYRNILLLLLLAGVVSAGCSGAKSLNGFNKTIKQIDTLAIIPSIINLKGIGPGDEIVFDRKLAEQISDSISSLIYTLLRKKYVLNVYPEYSDVKEDELFRLRDAVIRMDESKKTLPPVKMDKNIHEPFNHTKCRYVLLTYLEGMYKTEARLKEERGRRIPLIIGSAAIALATLGTVILIPKGPSRTIMKTFLYDTQNETVVMYHSSEVVDTSIRDYNTIRNFVLEGVKRLYYK